MKSRTRLQWDLFLDARIKTLFVLFFLNVQNKFNLLSSVMVQLHKRNKRKSSSQKNVHLSSLLSPWWTALVSLRESFSSYPEEPLTYNVFVYWLFKKKKKGRRRRSYKHLQDFLTLYSQQIGFCVTVLLHFLKIWAVMKRFLCCDLLENTRCLFFFFCLFVCCLSCRIQSWGGGTFLNVKFSGAEALCSSSFLL